MKRKVLPVLVVIFLILVIGAVTVAGYLYEKYSYSTERVDLDEYFGVTGDYLAVVLQDEMIEEQAVLRNGVCYFDLDTVHRYFNEGFYADRKEGLLLYTTAVENISVSFGGTTMGSAVSVKEASTVTELGYVAAYEENGTVYVAADYVRRFTNFEMLVFDRHVQVYTKWGARTVDTLLKDTAVRLKGGVKSPVLCDLTKGTKVEILDKMETWCKVKTEDSIIGYIERKMLEQAAEGTVVQEIPVKDYTEPEYTTAQMEGKVSLGWHSIGGVGGNATLDSMVASAKGMNVIAPTWFSLNDEEGNFRSFATKEYVDRAHDLGLLVWGVWDDFNYNLETGSSVSVLNVLSGTTTRQRLAGNIVSTALELGLDGVNLDFEKIGEEAGSHYIQFLKELSVECRRNALTLSIDNYVPYDFRDYYRLDIQGKVADYVIIMGYDEHWSGSGEPGSVASIDFVRNGISKSLEEVPAHKLVNALPFYTLLWKTEGTKVTDQVLSLKNIPDFVSRMKLQPRWDEETCQNYAEWSSQNTKYQLWIEDEASIAAKLSVMSAQNIAGVAVWRLGYGTESVWNLLGLYVSQ